MNRHILRLVGLLDGRLLYVRKPAHSNPVGSYWTTDLESAHLHDKRQADENADLLLEWAVPPRWKLVVMTAD